MNTKNIGIYIFDDVEVLDFAGPFEVFNTAGRVALKSAPLLPVPFRDFTIGAGSSQIKTRGGMMVKPQYTLRSHPPLDVLIIPGGVVTEELENGDLISWIGKNGRETELVASVCTGAFLLAKAGLLDNQPATTHWEDISDLREMFPAIRVKEDCRWVDNGKTVTSAGISAGIDMCLHLVERLEGRDLALKTARQMDYHWLEQ